MEKLTFNKNDLRKFGITLGLIFAVAALIIFLRHKQHALTFSIISAVFFLLGVTFPQLLKPPYRFGMLMSLILSWIITRIVLLVMFYVIFTPLGLIMRLFNPDILEKKIDRNKESYWKEKEKKEFNPADYEKLF
ncbi:MAG: SxtJ family membrane protein [Deltaproteobacteria bacterium]